MSRKQVIVFVVALCSTFAVACLAGGYFIISAWLAHRHGAPAAFGIPMVQSANRDAARAQCKDLAYRVRAYIDDPRLNPNGDVPTSWDQIPDINPEALRDPWGGQYQLVVPSQHGHTEGPDHTGFDVMCDCGGSGDVVGNW